MITYDDIKRINSKIAPTTIKRVDNYTGETTTTKYTTVNQRVTAFRMLYPSGTIKTDIVDFANGAITIKATISITDNGNNIILATGYAREVEGAGDVNITSFVENCETSAIGRALGFCGFGIDGSISAAEEAISAIITQGKQNTRAKSKRALNGHTEPQNEHKKTELQYKCENCGGKILGKDAESTKKQYGKALCRECINDASNQI